MIAARRPARKAPVAFLRAILPPGSRTETSENSTSIKGDASGKAYKPSSSKEARLRGGECARRCLMIASSKALKLLSRHILPT